HEHFVRRCAWESAFSLSVARCCRSSAWEARHSLQRISPFWSLRSHLESGCLRLLGGLALRQSRHPEELESLRGPSTGSSPWGSSSTPWPLPFAPSMRV